MTCLEKYQMDYPGEGAEYTTIYRCPHLFGILPKPDNCCHEQTPGKGTIFCVECWSREYIPPETISTSSTNPEPHILDSGDRTEFESGAVRDMREGKGRCDLLPLDVVYEMFTRSEENEEELYLQVFYELDKFMRDGDRWHLFNVLKFGNPFEGMNRCTMLLETAIHFEEGAKKYGDNNWRKGIPVRCYIDSSIRHFLKYLRGDQDEPHDRAFCWNIMCAIWTCINMPELNDYAKEEKK